MPSLFNRKSSDPRSAPALQKLELIEAEMKRIGYWTENPPVIQAAMASGQIKNYLEAPSFELWLQCVFLPNARKAAINGEFPEGSQVGLMAMRQYDYHSCIKEAHPLMNLLYEFDAIIESKEPKIER